ncbi:MAG: hypothetical protein ACHQRM_14835 [Bacteroidia bacterium]
MPQHSVTPKTIQLRIGSAFLREDGIFQVNLLPHETFSIQDVKELVEVKQKLFGTQLVKNLWIIGEHTAPDHEAREYSTTGDRAYNRRADAFVIHSLSQRLVANFYLKVNKPKVPTHFFSEEKDAVEWLLKQ